MLLDTLPPAARSRSLFHFASFGAFVILWPLQVHAQCTTENLARSGTATASSTFPGYSPARVNDGNRSTSLGGTFSWSNDRQPGMPSTLPASLNVALPAAASVDRVVLYSTSGWEIRDYDVQGFSAGQWTNLTQIRGNTQTVRTLSFPPVTLSQVRIVGLSGPNQQTVHVRVNELEVCRAAPVATSATIAGTVLLLGQGVAPNTLIDLGGGRTALTNAFGSYRFDNVPLGTYTFRARRAGLTCGSPQFQNDTYTRSLIAGTNVAPAITCYNRNPIVYATGWTDNYNRFAGVRGALQSQGYLAQEAQIQTSTGYTPPLRVNAENVRRGIDQALYITGQPQAILFGHSMGGLVSRRYVESNLYRNDVSQVFTFGSPHRGIPNLVTLACLANQPAVCEMSKPGMLLFNITHGQRPGVAYHSIGGDAPMWRQERICFRIFGRRICIGSISLPDLNYRNFGGWLAGIAIPYGDDALAQTYSSTGMPGTLDRFATREVHINSGLGHRDYYDWNGGLSQDTYRQCLEPVLVARSRTNCGATSFQSVLFPLFKQASVGFKFGAQAAPENFEQHSRIERHEVSAGQRIERKVEVDGSPTLFVAKWSSGGARITLVDPSGQVFDPEFASSILDGEPEPGEVISDEFDPSMVLFEASKDGAVYQFPAPRPGTWVMIVETDAGMPGGNTLETSVAFASDFGLNFANEFPFWIAKERVELTLNPSSPFFSASGEVRILRQDGRVDVVELARQADGSLRGSYDVPNTTGVAEVEWFASGITATGQPFERGGNDSVQIGRRSLVVNDVGSENAVPAPNDPKRYLALDIPVTFTSDFAGDAMVSGDLVDATGEIVANVAQTQQVTVGDNRTILRFAGQDIYAQRRNGPYRLTNLITVDQRGEDLLSDWLLDRMTTAAYDYRQFAPPEPMACGKSNVLRGGIASASSSYDGYNPARIIDGNRSSALGGEYSWSNARETGIAPALPATLQVSLLTPAVVDQIIVRSTADWEIRDYDLQYSDGTAWNTIESVRGNTHTVREHRIPATRIEGLRIVGLPSSDHQALHVRVNEVEAYRCLAPASVSLPRSAALATHPAKQAAKSSSPRLRGLR